MSNSLACWANDSATRKGRRKKKNSKRSISSQTACAVRGGSGFNPAYINYLLDLHTSAFTQRSSSSQNTTNLIVKSPLQQKNDNFQATKTNSKSKTNKYYAAAKCCSSIQLLLSSVSMTPLHVKGHDAVTSPVDNFLNSTEQQDWSPSHSDAIWSNFAGSTPSCKPTSLHL